MLKLRLVRVFPSNPITVDHHQSASEMPLEQRITGEPDRLVCWLIMQA